MAGIQDLLAALQQGGLPQGNLSQVLPLLQGLGGNIELARSLDPAMLALLSSVARPALGVPPRMPPQNVVGNALLQRMR